MIQIKNNVLWRSNVKVGWISGDHIYDYTGKKIASFVGNDIYDGSGTRVAHIVGEYLWTIPAAAKSRIEDSNQKVMGDVSDACRAAIAMFLG
jgi:hypothetical protein